MVADELPAGHARRQAAARNFNYSEMNGPYNDESVTQRFHGVTDLASGGFRGRKGETKCRQINRY
jgi:hypothetical protein